MKDEREARLWKMLVRVRGIRVERRRLELEAAREALVRADAALAERRADIARHEDERGVILSLCCHGVAAGALWRTVLRGHDGRSVALDAALARARRIAQTARDDLSSASTLLQRQIAARDDAAQRVSRIAARADKD